MREISKTYKERLKAKELAINTMNLFFKEYNKNIEEIQKVSKHLDRNIGRSKRRGYNHSFLINKAMQSTKSDPRAALGKDDPLRNISKAIFRRDLLPTTHKGYKQTLEIIFAERHSDSVRVHVHERDNMVYKPLKELISTISVIDPDVIYPEEDQKQLDDKSMKKLIFKKRKATKSQEEVF